jgi:polygalacturonase
MKNNNIWLICAFGSILCQTPLLSGKTLNVAVDYGADSTGAKYATANIQKAIDACNPGDTLLIPPGTYLLNDGLKLKSHMTVILSSNAVLQANTKADWVNNRSPIVSGNGLNHVTISGGGRIDGGGLVYTRHKGTEPGRGIRFVECTDVTVQNVSVSNIPNFAVDFQHSENLTIESLTIRGRPFDFLKGSADGMDIEGCAHAAISKCNIEVGDDGLCLKALDGKHPCHDIKIRDCILASTCNAFKIGTDTLADVYDVVAEDITVNRYSNPSHGNPIPSGDCIAAIALESNDHHRTHDITCRNFTINSCYCPIYVELENRQSKEKGVMGNLDNIVIENVNCLRSTEPIIFNWQRDGANKMTNVTLSNITVQNYGTKRGGTLSYMNGNYPDADKSGSADAYGIFARGVVGLKLKCLRFYDQGRSKRQKLVFEDTVKNVDSSAIDDCSAEPQ